MNSNNNTVTNNNKACNESHEGSWRKKYKEKSLKKYQELRKREITQRKIKLKKDKTVRNIEQSLLKNIYGYFKSQQEQSSIRKNILNLFEEAEQEAAKNDTQLSFHDTQLKEKSTTSMQEKVIKEEKSDNPLPNSSPINTVVIPQTQCVNESMEKLVNPFILLRSNEIDQNKPISFLKPHKCNISLLLLCIFKMCSV